MICRAFNPVRLHAYDQAGAMALCRQGLVEASQLGVNRIAFGAAKRVSRRIKGSVFTDAANSVDCPHLICYSRFILFHI